MNNPQAVASLQATLALSPETAHKGTILACLAYRAYPLPNQQEDWDLVYADEAFFLGEAMKGHPEWLGKLMADRKRAPHFSLFICWEAFPSPFEHYTYYPSSSFSLLLRP
jgi:hypothetical protein